MMGGILVGCSPTTFLQSIQPSSTDQDPGGPGAAAWAHGIDQNNKKCLADFAQWQKNNGWKAVAVSRLHENIQYCGMSWGYETSEEAEERAISECTNSFRKGNPALASTCKITVIEGQSQASQ
jgi:hypothetical protein